MVRPAQQHPEEQQGGGERTGGDGVSPWPTAGGHRARGLVPLLAPGTDVFVTAGGHTDILSQPEKWLRSFFYCNLYKLQEGKKKHLKRSVASKNNIVLTLGECST